MTTPVAALKPLKNSSSYDILPPNFSELRLLLLGNCWSLRSSVGNLLLGQTEFTKDSTRCVKVRGSFKDKTLTVINCPDLLQPSAEPLTDIKDVSSPGPHVFLLVLQPEDFTEQHKTRLESVLESFSEQAFDRSLVMFMSQTEGPESVEKCMREPHIRDMVIRCRYRYLCRKNLELPELLTRVGQIIKENSGDSNMIPDPSEEEDTGLTMARRTKGKPSLNLVLFGRTRAGKTSAAQSILGRAEVRAASSPGQCVKHQGEVCGRWVSLVELPALSGEPLETVMQQCLRCISLCGPEGVHAFILVLPLGPLTDEDKDEFEILQNTLSSRVKDFSMVLNSVESGAASVNFARKSGLEELSQSCGGRALCLNFRDQQQVLEVMNTVHKLTQGGASTYTKDMFIEALMERAPKSPEVYSSPMGLRIALVGKSGSGKSSTTNTILGEKYFEPKAAPKRAKASCEEVSGTVQGRRVTIVNTPPLFDKSFSDEELSRCISPELHAILLLLPIGNIQKEDRDSLLLIKKRLGEKAVAFITIVFTRGDELDTQSVQNYVQDCDGFVKDMLRECQGRCHVVNNKDQTNLEQVVELLRKIEKTVQANCGFTKDMFERERKEAQHEKEVKALKNQLTESNRRFEQEKALRERQLKEKEELVKREQRSQRKEQEEEAKRRRRQEETVRAEWRRRAEEAERRTGLEAEERRRAEKQLEQLRRETERRRQEWERERAEIQESRCQELKQNLEVQSERNRELLDEYLRKRKKWTAILFVSLLCSLFLGYYLFLSHI